MPLSPDAIQRLERATLDAVAPAQVHTLGDWLLPSDPSTIGRATSAVHLHHEALDASAVAAIIQHYQGLGMPSKFRIADVPALGLVQAALRAHGLNPTQPTLVQTGHLSDVLRLPAPHPVSVQPNPSELWGRVYTAAGFDPVDGAFRRAALSRSPFVVYAHVHHEGGPLAAGTASLSQGWASIHGMRTVPGARGRGLASAILVALARHALAQGMTDVFLQVEEDNHSAQSLYRRAGFTTAWRYHYWR